jgi:DNA-binding CsgD family transcriptional regulator
LRVNLPWTVDRFEVVPERGPCLLFKDADDRQQLFVLGPDVASASVGRQESADLVLDWDDQVSRVHARFERMNDDWEVVDDGLSRNGTYVNGERLSGRRRLSDGDTLLFGRTRMTFRSDAGEPQAEVSLSTTQRRVLAALCRPFKGGSRFASPATDEQIAEDLFLSVGEVRSHLNVLYVKLGVPQLPEGDKRLHAVERALASGLISERDL